MKEPIHVCNWRGWVPENENLGGSWMPKHSPFLCNLYSRVAKWADEIQWFCVCIACLHVCMTALSMYTEVRGELSGVGLSLMWFLDQTRVTRQVPLYDEPPLHHSPEWSFTVEVLPEKVAEVIDSSLPCVAVLVTCWVWVMGVGDGRQGIQPEFTPRLMMTAVQGQAVPRETATQC